MSFHTPNNARIELLVRIPGDGTQIPVNPRIQRIDWPQYWDTFEDDWEYPGRGIVPINTPNPVMEYRYFIGEDDLFPSNITFDELGGAAYGLAERSLISTNDPVGVRINLDDSMLTWDPDTGLGTVHLDKLPLCTTAEYHQFPDPENPPAWPYIVFFPDGATRIIKEPARYISKNDTNYEWNFV